MNRKKWLSLAVILGISAFIVYGMLYYKLDMFITPEKMAERVIKDTTKAPEAYQGKLDEIIRTKREREAVYSDLIYNPTYNMTFQKIDNNFYRGGSDVAIEVSIRVGHVDKWGHARTARGFILMRMNKHNMFNQWEITEILFLPIEDERTSWSLEDYE